MILLSLIDSFQLSIDDTKVEEQFCTDMTVTVSSLNAYHLLNYPTRYAAGIVSLTRNDKHFKKDFSSDSLWQFCVKLWVPWVCSYCAQSCLLKVKSLFQHGFMILSFWKNLKRNIFFSYFLCFLFLFVIFSFLFISF